MLVLESKGREVKAFQFHVHFSWFLCPTSIPYVFCFAFLTILTSIAVMDLEKTRNSSVLSLFLSFFHSFIHSFLH